MLVVYGAAALVLLVGASQVQWGLLRMSELVEVTPRHVEWVLAAVSAVGLAASGPVVRRFPAVPPRPSYDARGRAGVVGWALVGVLGAAPVAGWLAGRVFRVPVRDPVAAAGAGRSVGELLLDDVLVPALWEELVWRVLLLGLLLRVVGPRAAVVVQAVSFAVAHTSWSVGFGRVPHRVDVEYLLDHAVTVGVSGLVFGFIVVELGSVWPAVVVHALCNIPSTFGHDLSWLELVSTEVILMYGFVALALTRRQARARLGAWLAPARVRGVPLPPAGRQQPGSGVTPPA